MVITGIIGFTRLPWPVPSGNAFYTREHYHEAGFTLSDASRNVVPEASSSNFRLESGFSSSLNTRTDLQTRDTAGSGG